MTCTPLTLEGGKVRLVPLTREHLARGAERGTQRELWAATTIRVLTPADMETYFARALAEQAAGTAVPFAIIERRTGEFIGSTRFHSMAPAHRRLEIGFTWITPAWQRTGANTEAKYLMLQYAFETWGCLRVQFSANAINAKSRRALEGLGARLEAVLRQHRLAPHLGPCDVAVYSIVASEWPAVRRELERKLAR